MPETMYCTNHPQTETLLRCTKCNRPFCLKCMQRTPTGLRCYECLNIQRVGYYTATPVDYVLACVVGLIVAIIGGVIAAVIGGFWLIMIFLGPIAGGIIAEAIRLAVGNRRGRYLWLVAAGATVVGALIGAALFPLGAALFALIGGEASVVSVAGFSLALLARQIFNLGLLIYIGFAVATVYARLRV
jgi:hypothetical protein